MRSRRLGRLGPNVVLIACGLFFLLPLLAMTRFALQNVPTIRLGWSFELWGVFLYWWAGAIYLIETSRLLRIPRVEPATESDTLGS